MTPSRDQIQLVPCPVCPARSGEACHRGKRSASHAARMERAQDVFNGKPDRHARNRSVASGETGVARVKPFW